MPNIEISQSLGEVVIFNTVEGAVNVQLDLVDETVWVNQSGIAELFSTSKQVVSYHIFSRRESWFRIQLSKKF